MCSHAHGVLRVEANSASLAWNPASALLSFKACCTGGRVVEGTGLENRHTCKGIESSNLSLSVTNEAQRDEVRWTSSYARGAETQRHRGAENNKKHRGKCAKARG